MADRRRQIRRSSLSNPSPVASAREPLVENDYDRFANTSTSHYEDDRQRPSSRIHGTPNMRSLSIDSGRPPSSGSESGMCSPSPPPHPPSSGRPRSRYRPPSLRKALQDSSFDLPDSEAPSSRPGSSSLNRYSPLPAISPSRKDDSGDTPKSSTTPSKKVPHRSSKSGRTSQVKSPSQEFNKVPINNDNDNLNNVIQKDAAKKIWEEATLPTEPGDSVPRLLLAVKLPNGQRVQRHFALSDSLATVLLFTSHCAKEDLMDHELVNNVSKDVKVYRDLTKKLMELDIKDRTLLYLQLPGD